MTHESNRPFDIAIVVVAAALLFGSGGFAIGRLTAPKAGASSATGGTSPLALGGSGSGHSHFYRHAGGTFLIGTVATVAGNTVTLSDNSGNTHTITVTGSTAYIDPSGGSASQAALTAGTRIAVSGQLGANGSVTATRVIINPQFPGGASSSGGNQYQAN